MVTREQFRLANDRAHPRLMTLWWALRPLTSVVRFMQTGAHPDDEISGLLAALAVRDGINTSYACATRGEGGQNDIGIERGSDLGALRTREMERACDVLGMRLYWLSTHAEDTITDFGFSKSGEETLSRWGRERTLNRLIEIVRTEKPDILCPTFLDVPGQHGHHRAMTEAALQVVGAAADPSLEQHLPPWQVKKLYLPAWSGAGQSYDDGLPPPPATLTVPGTDREIMTGWGWDRIGQHSRASHRTQGMGRWSPAGTGHDWPLHLAISHVSDPDIAIDSGLHRTLGEFAKRQDAGASSTPLAKAQAQIDAAVSAFPDFEAVADHAADALEAVQRAIETCPAVLAGELQHRLRAKGRQLGHVLRLALGVEARAVPESSFIDSATPTVLRTELDQGAAEHVGMDVELPTGWDLSGDRLSVSAEVPEGDPYRPFYDPQNPPAPRLVLNVAHKDTRVKVPLAFETEPMILPTRRATLSASASLINTRMPNRTIEIGVSDLAPGNAQIALDLPEGWRAERNDHGFTVSAPTNLADGRYSIAASLDGQPAMSVSPIDHTHVGPTARCHRAEVTIGAWGVAIPDGKVGYIGSGNDRVGDWLREMGADVVAISDAEIDSDSALAAFDAIVIGIFAVRFRSGLLDAMPRLHRWTEAGGTLLTLYHRPWDNWDPNTVPPRRLEIGQPSLRWRVTDERADVTQIAEHPILSTPNPIGETEWLGWVKERGLYFAMRWDPAYRALLSMSDPGEEPHEGALLVADIGKGRHVHCALILHHQMEHLVPGAFRLLANFIAPRE